MELQTLRESNARLTTALQESAASVEQWKRQFSICRDENDRLRSKVGLGSQWDRGPGRLEWAEEIDGPPEALVPSLPSPHRQERDIFSSPFNAPSSCLS